jgi:hypothetical protein
LCHFHGYVDSVASGHNVEHVLDSGAYLQNLEGLVYYLLFGNPRDRLGNVFVRSGICRHCHYRDVPWIKKEEIVHKPFKALEICIAVKQPLNIIA